MSMSDEEKERLTKLLVLVHAAIEQDEALRKKYQIGDKFRFVRERLKEVLAYLEADEKVVNIENKEVQLTLQEGEVPVYVYLFNAKGVLLANWINMLTPKVFYEYSVNRPIYPDKTSLEAMLRTKKDKQQHAYLTIAVKKADILDSENETAQKDALGNPLIKVREGSLDVSRLLAFTHNGQDYTLNQEGRLIKKP